MQGGDVDKKRNAIHIGIFIYFISHPNTTKVLDKLAVVTRFSPVIIVKKLWYLQEHGS